MIYITGGSSFIANHLHKYLNLKKIENKIFTRNKHSRFDYLSDYEKINFNKNVIIIHFAQNLNTNNKLENNQLIKMYKKISDYKWAHQIYISSAQIYGDENINLKNEKAQINLKNNYAKLKYKCENLFKNKKATILRLSNVYGKGMSDKNVLSDIIRQKNNKKILVNSIYPIRDYVYVDDVVIAIYLCIIKKYRGILNIGTGKGYSVENLAKLILETYKKNDFQIISKQTYNLSKSNLVVDISKAKNIIDWNPNFKLKNGIKKLIV